jgi:serine/threonine-protein kinase
LGHPHIVQVFDFNVLDDGRAYLVMELLQGESLRDRLSRGPVPLPEALEIAAQVGSALSRAHAAGIVHRDLKPENVFLCANPVPSARPLAKVLDFGISKIQGSLTVVTQDASLLGTPKYMSPEQAKGENTTLDARTDQFALAAIAYEMVTGQAAFPGSNVTSVLLKVLNDDPAPIAQLRADVPPVLETVILRGLAKDRAERFSDVEAFVGALMAPLGADTVEDTLASGSGEARVPPALHAPPASGFLPHPETPTGPTHPVGPAGADRSPGSAADSTAPVEAALSDRSVPSTPSTPKAPRGRLPPAAWGLAVAALLLSMAATAYLMRSPAPTVEPVEALPEASARSNETGEKTARPGPRPGPVGTPEAEEAARTQDAEAGSRPHPAAARVESDGESRSPEPQASPAAGPVRKAPARRLALFADLPRPLAEVMAALKRGDKLRASQLVIQAMNKVGRTPEAFAVATVVACSRKDLGKARAFLANVPRRGRRQVVRRCARWGLDL